MAGLLDIFLPIPDYFLPIPGAESLPFYPLVFKLVVFGGAALLVGWCRERMVGGARLVDSPNSSIPFDSIARRLALLGTVGRWGLLAVRVLLAPLGASTHIHTVDSLSAQ